MAETEKDVTEEMVREALAHVYATRAEVDRLAAALAAAREWEEVHHETAKSFAWTISACLRVLGSESEDAADLMPLVAGSAVALARAKADLAAEREGLQGIVRAWNEALGREQGKTEQAEAMARVDVKQAVEEWFVNASLDDLFAVKGWPPTRQKAALAELARLHDLAERHQQDAADQAQGVCEHGNVKCQCYGDETDVPR